MKENNFNEIKERYDRECQEALKKTGIFYAFSNEQFEKYRTYKEESSDGDYVYVGAGAYIHKKDKNNLDEYFNVILPGLKKRFINSINIDDLIEYELINHECYYTGDFYEIVPVIESYLNSDISQRCDITEQIEMVYRKNYKKSVEMFG